MIRLKGRNEFIKLNPQDFSSIIHDYSGERKGFILWRDALDGQLVKSDIAGYIHYCITFGICPINSMALNTRTLFQVK